MSESAESDRQKRLDAALDRGRIKELPPNQPKGILGEMGLNFYKVDEFEPDLNAGVSQEFDSGPRFLLVILAMLLVPPVGYWMLWRERRYTIVVKLVWSAVMAIPVVFVWGAILLGSW